MLKKILIGILFVAFVGILITGAVIRTKDKVEQTTNVAASDEGNGKNASSREAGNSDGQEGEQRRAGSATDSNEAVSSKGGRGGNNGGGLALNEENAQGVWESYTGVLTSVSSDALTMETTEGETILVDGRTWSFAQELGFTAEEGDEVRLEGFFEEGEFKVVSIQDLSSGDEVILRDASGQPGWAGRGKGGI
jgi:hypothetical protein